MKVSYSWGAGKGGKAHRTFINKAEKQAYRFKVGRDRQILMFHAKAIRFMIRVALSIKMLTPSFEEER